MADASRLLWRPLQLASSAQAPAAPAAAAAAGGANPPPSWKERDQKLKSFIDKLPKQFDYRVSFEDGAFAFVDSKNIILAKASVKLLMSYNLVKKSVVGGWANPSVPKKYVGSELKGPQAASIKNTDVEQKEADMMAHRIADASGCDFVYKAVNRANWVYLGLINLKILDSKQRTQFNSTTSYLELVVMIIARLRKVIMMRQAQPVSIAKAYHDAGLLFFQQAKTTFSKNTNAVKTLNAGGTMLMRIANELKMWAIDVKRAHNPEQVKQIMQKLLNFEQAAILSGR